MSDDKNAAFLPMGMGVGIALGVALGVALDNVGLGIALGVAIGAGLGVSGMAMGKKKKDGDETPGGDADGD